MNCTQTKTLVLSVTTFLLAACATGTPTNTVSGWPEALFAGSDRLTVLSQIATGCANKGYFVADQGPSHVLCSRTMDDLQGAFAQVLLGNSYSTTPQMKVRFSALSSGDAIRVQAQPWIETQMALGQINRAELRSGQAASDVQQFLYSLGGEPTQ